MIPLNNHTHYSLLQGYCKPAKLFKKAADLGYSSLVLSDINSLSGTINFLTASEDEDAKSVKPIIGTKLYLDTGGYVQLLAKNLDGWKELIYLYSYTNASENNTITLEHLKHVKNCICISGDLGSSLYSSIVKENSVYVSSHPGMSLSFYLKENYQEQASNHMSQLRDIFNEDLYIGIQRCNESVVAIDKIAADIFTEEGKKLGIKRVALNNTYIHEDKEIDELRILLCSREKIKFSNVHDYVKTDAKAHMFRFFETSQFGLYDKDYYQRLYSEEEIANTLEIESKVTHFNLLKNPEAPEFTCPNGMSTKDYLLQLCREGWKRVSRKTDNSRTQEYVDRIQSELEVINRAGLEGYFLVVQDYVNWARNEGMLIGCGRGSAAGCLISYLLGITSIDPLLYGLMFERFYNEGRNAPGKISYPDIDVDFPVYGREKVIDYIREKYKKENVSQVFTLQEIQGRSAIREVLRVYGACPQDFINEISKKIPQKAAIADKLEEAQEKSIIRWTLENEPELISDWCKLDGDKLTGEYAMYFEKAIEIEGTFKGYGKHASAVVIANEPIASICPMIKDKSSNQLLAAIEYEELEKMGILKMDVLGTTILDKLMGVNELLEFGTLTNHNIVEEETNESEI